ncbi:MAG TPA: hydantoinase/oxoprolinase family protein, partial [Hyphomicrobiaceae bacterium]|nr:hydantoinase/oxoprolinase family protein [Hyphomicrobiaceae bacterium]
GASGLHACETADEIGITRVVFPRDPGTLSAWGMLYSDIVHALARARLMKADAGSLPQLSAIVAELDAAGRQMLTRDGVAAEAQQLPVFLDMRYPGQAYEIQVPLETPARLAEAVARFHERHLAQYAHAEPHVIPDIVTVRIAATGRLAKPIEHTPPIAKGDPAKGRRRVLVGEGWHDCPVLDRARLASDSRNAGPLIVEEEHATHLVPPGWSLVVAPTGDLVATKDSGDRT